MNSLKNIALIVGCGFAPLALSAPITFDFSQYQPYSSIGHSYLGSDNVHSVTVAPYAEYGTPYLASSPTAGLYIYTCTDYDVDCHYDDNTHQIDGYGPNEAAVLDFGQQVTLLSATFSYIGSNDDFTLIVDGNTVLDNVDPGGGFFSIFNFGNSTVGSEFSFLADHWTDDFKLYSVTADFVSNVPEPASLTLLGLGLAALGSIRRRKD